MPTGAGGQGEGSAAERRRRAGPGGAASRGLLLLLLLALFGLSRRAARLLCPLGARGDVHPRCEPTEQEAAAVW